MRKVIVAKNTSAIADTVDATARALRARQAQQQPAAENGRMNGDAPRAEVALYGVPPEVAARLQPRLEAAMNAELRRALAGESPLADPAEQAREVARKAYADMLAEPHHPPRLSRPAPVPAPTATRKADESWPPGDQAPPLENRHLRHVASATLSPDAVRKLAGDPAAEARAAEEARLFPVGEDLAESVAKERRLDMLASVLVDLERRRQGR
jgi:hypothetical protein